MRLQRKLFLAYLTRVFSIFTSADKSYLTYPFPTCGMDKQVAQRATTAHRSPMCQGQISFQKTYKWAMETRGPKSNSSELLCPSWLPATLMMIRSKMNELALRHHFPIRSVRVAERLALPTSVHGVAGSNPAGTEILPEPKRRFIAQSLSCSPFHRLEMTEILLKGRKILTHPSIFPL